MSSGFSIGQFLVFSLTFTGDQMLSLDFSPDDMIGCFTEPSDETLLHEHIEFFDGSSQMTIQKCIQICQNQAFALSLLQGGMFCYCSSDISRSGLELNSDNTNCNTACSGNNSAKCGGETSYNVYLSIPYNREVQKSTIESYIQRTTTDAERTSATKELQSEPKNDASSSHITLNTRPTDISKLSGVGNDQPLPDQSKDGRTPVLTVFVVTTTSVIAFLLMVIIVVGIVYAIRKTRYPSRTSAITESQMESSITAAESNQTKKKKVMTTSDGVYYCANLQINAADMLSKNDAINGREDDYGYEEVPLYNSEASPDIYYSRQNNEVLLLKENGYRPSEKGYELPVFPGHYNHDYACIGQGSPRSSL